MKNTILIILAIGVFLGQGAFAQKKDVFTKLNERQLKDKVLGMLVGSAIGDAMGAPTEMWSREAIQLEYGLVEKLDSMVREPSAEGTWQINLPAGGTTDDSRWKKLATEYLLTQNVSLNEYDFANFIRKEYLAHLNNFKNINDFSPQPYEENMRKMAWLQEWALVAKPFVEKDYLGYSRALNKFYGGEMVCGGMLYAPTIGAFFPNDALKAYKETYKISIFDIGYARDISALIAAMTSAAMSPNATKESVLSVLREIDPEGYFESRLVGRTSFRILKDALSIVKSAKDLDKINTKLPISKQLYLDSLYLTQMYEAFRLLDMKNQDMPFHAGEIHLQVLTALLFADFDFQKTMVFLVNLGRDNDTTSAVAGGILGAFYGFERLPESMKYQVMKVAKEKLHIDFDKLASQLTHQIISIQK